MRTARGGRTASVITTAALLGALALPATAAATEVLEAPASAATTTAVGPELEPASSPVATGEPTPEPAPEPALEPTAVPEPAAEPIATPVAAETPVAAPPAPGAAGIAAGPVLTLPRIDFTAGSTIIGERGTGWGDGLDVVGTGFAPGSTVVVSLMDGPTPEARTEVVASATGGIVRDDWLPATLDGGTSLYPHLPRPGEEITVVAEGSDAAGVALVSNAVPLSITRPAPSVLFQVAEDGSVVDADQELQVPAFRVYGIAASLGGFDRDEVVTTTLTAPDGSVEVFDAPLSRPLYGEVSVSLDERTMPDLFGTFTVTGTGATSGRTVSSSLVQVPSPEAGLRIWPQAAIIGAAPQGPVRADEPVSGGALWGFAPSERVSVSVYSVDGVRQRLADGGTSLPFAADAVGWSLVSIGERPLADPDPEVYCVVALGASSGRTASHSFDYGLVEGDSRWDEADCSVAEAAAGSGTGTGTGTTVTAGGRHLAATGASPAAPLALAAFGILGGLALMVTSRRRA